MWFLRSVEVTQGRWACRWGRREYDVHPHLEASLRHLAQLAEQLGPVEVFVHHGDGRVVPLRDAP